MFDIMQQIYFVRIHNHLITHYSADVLYMMSVVTLLIIFIFFKSSLYFIIEKQPTSLGHNALTSMSIVHITIYNIC